MKRSLKGLLVVLAMVMSLGAAQGAFAAETYTVEGTIIDMGTTPNVIVVRGDTQDYEIYGIPFNYLLSKYSIVLDIDDYIVVEVYEFTCSDGSTKLKAIAIDGLMLR